MNQKSRFEYRIFQTMENIEPSIWDSLFDASDIFHSHSFLFTLEQSHVEDAHYHYVVFYENEKPIASAVLSDFAIQLDLFIGQNRFAQWLKKLKPDFFYVKILFCGTPVSIGQRNFIAPSVLYADLLPLLAHIMDDICRQQNIRFQVFKEFFEADATQMQPILEQNGFFKGYSLPYIKLPIRWQTFDDYLLDLRSGYRRLIKKSLDKLAKSGGIVTLTPPQYVTAATFFKWYMSVMDRATVKLETLNEAFFEQAFVKMADDIRLLTLIKDDKPLAATFLISHGAELTFVWAGKPIARADEYDPYFNLLTQMVVYAIENGYKTLNFGQTAYFTKQRLGGDAHELFLFFKSSSWFWHRLIRSFNAVIFPKTPLPLLNVWRMK